jgi:sec-independent protein translocase protein TatA
MFGIGHGWEILVILAIALLVFGPKKLPEMGKAIGSSIKEFKKGMDGLTNPKEEPPAEKPVERSTYNELKASEADIKVSEFKTSDQQTLSKNND